MNFKNFFKNNSLEAPKLVPQVDLLKMTGSPPSATEIFGNAGLTLLADFE